MKIHDVQQRSPEWMQLRLGIPTASDFHRILTPTGKRSSQADAYMHRLLAEWLTGAPLDSVETQWMQRGSELEDEAIAAYEFASNKKVQRVGFVTTANGLIGCSPDGLVDDDGGLEMKCPAPQTHIGYLLSKTVDEDYKPQVQGCISICERDWWDVQSYYPGLPTSIIHAERDDRYIALLVEALAEFCEKLGAGKRTLIDKYGAVPKQIAPKPEIDKYGFDLTDEDAAAIFRWM